MLKTIVSSWDAENGIATVNILDTNSGRVFQGNAVCHPVDMDMMSRLTGLEIAYKRAYINYLEYLKKYFTVKYKTLNEFQKEIANFRTYNANYQIEKRLQGNIYRLENDLTFLKHRILKEKASLKKYITQKDELYTKIRERRKESEKN